MARIRTIKPDFWEKEEFANISLQAMLLYIGMKNFADDSGVIVSNEVVIKNKVFAAREDIRRQQVSLWLKELVDNSILVPFDYEDKGYYAMDLADERIDKPQKSKIPQEIINEALSRKNQSVTVSPEIIPEYSGIFANIPAGEERKGVVEGKDMESIREDCDSIIVDLTEGVVRGRWRDSFDLYLSGLRQVYSHRVKDRQFIEEQKKYHPGVNVVLSLEKACKEYWAKEAGWKKKKASKSESIDWHTTFVNTLNLKSNLVYEQRTNQADKGAVSDSFREQILRDIGAI